MNRFDTLTLDVCVPNHANVISIPAIRSELRRQMHIPVKLSGVNRSVVTYAMVDSGASATFLSSHFVERNRVRTEHFLFQ